MYCTGVRYSDGEIVHAPSQVSILYRSHFAYILHCRAEKTRLDTLEKARILRMSNQVSLGRDMLKHANRANLQMPSLLFVVNIIGVLDRTPINTLRISFGDKAPRWNSFLVWGMHFSETRDYFYV